MCAALSVSCLEGRQEGGKEGETEGGSKRALFMPPFRRGRCGRRRQRCVSDGRTAAAAAAILYRAEAAPRPRSFLCYPMRSVCAFYDAVV